MDINGKEITPASDGKLRIAVSPRALFDMSREDTLFENEGLDTYRDYQLGHLDQPYGKGVAYNFIERILNFNAIGEDTGTKGHGSLVEVIVMSHMDPSTGVRVMRTIKHYGLNVYQSVFSSGSSLTPFIASMGVSLYLSTDEDSVREALDAGFPAGRVMGPITAHDDPNGEVRIAFDFDGVLADDSSEHRFATDGLAGFCDHEYRHAFEPMRPGPLLPFLESLGHLQKAELDYKAEHPNYRRRLKIAICTARGMPSDVRVIKSLEHWGINVDIACFRDGCEKAPFLKGFDASLFFDDQLRHIDAAEQYVPSVHVPFGVRNVEKCDSYDDNKNVSSAHDVKSAAASNIVNTVDTDESANMPSSDSRILIDLTDSMDEKHEHKSHIVLPDGHVYIIDKNIHFDIADLKPHGFVPRTDDEWKHIYTHDKAKRRTNDNRKADDATSTHNDKNNDATGSETNEQIRRNEIINRVMNCPFIDAIEDVDGFGGINFKRPQSAGKWAIHLKASSLPTFGMFSPATGFDTNLIIKNENGHYRKTYLSRNSGPVDCVSVGALSSYIINDIDDISCTDRCAIRTLVVKVKKENKDAAKIAASNALSSIEHIPGVMFSMAFAEYDDINDNESKILSCSTMAEFTYDADSYDFAHTRVILTQINRIAYEYIKKAVHSATLVSYSIEPAMGYRIAHAIIDFDEQKMRRDKIDEILKNENVKER